MGGGVHTGGQKMGAFSVGKKEVIGVLSIKRQVFLCIGQNMCKSVSAKNAILSYEWLKSLKCTQMA